MELTKQEGKMLANMRKQQAQWPKVRWMLLILGIGAVIAFSFLFDSLSDILYNNEMLGIYTFTVLFPVIFFWIVLGGFLAGKALTEWRGNPERTLLLKIVNELENISENRK